MKFYLALLMSVSIAASLYSRDITTLSGTTYKDAKIFDSNPREIIISYQDKDDPKLTVMKPVNFKDLPDEIKKEYKYDPVKAEAYEKALIRAEQKRDANNQDNDTEQTTGNVNLQLAPAPIAPDQIGGGTAPGEKDGKAEGALMKREADDADLAPGEKEGLVEGREIKGEALDKNIAPEEKENLAEGREIKREAGDNDFAPGEDEGAKEARKIKRDARGTGKAPGE